MDIGAIATVVSTDSLAQVQGQAQVLVLKKALDIQAESAIQLIQAVPQSLPVQPGQPGALINTHA